VESISAPGGPNSILTVTTLGRDQVLRFKAGDWVEVLDDHTEFAGDHGVLTRIAAPPDQANHTIAVSPAIPAGLFDPTDDSRHTRVRRWDQKNTGAGSDVDPATGLITVAPGPLDIEDGIQVSFAAAVPGGQLHVGDYWIFAARTADASVEALTGAPPRGVLHHYSRLGFISGTGDKFTFTNCRPPWPLAGGGCCCTFTAKPGDPLQSIVNNIASGSSTTICLQPGVYNLPLPLVLTSRQSGTTIEGCNDGATIQAQAGSEGNFLDGLFVLSEASGVTLRGLTFNLPMVPFVAAGGKLAGVDGSALAAIGGTQASTLSNLFVSIGIRPISCDGLTIRECSFFCPTPDVSPNVFAAAILAGGPARAINIQDCAFNAETFNQASLAPFQMLIGCAIVPATVIQSGVGAGAAPGPLSGIVLPCSNQDLVFRNNFFGGSAAAILVYGETSNVRIEQNDVQSAYSGIWILGRTTPPTLQPFTSQGSPPPLTVEEALQDPVLEIGSTIARGYPLPAAFSDPSLGVSVSGVRLSLVTPPFPAGSLLATFDILNQFVAAMESAAAAQKPPLGLVLSVHCAGNLIDAETGDGNSGSGGALVIWGDDTSTSKVILSANRAVNSTSTQDSSFMSTVTVLQADLCAANGNIILNEAANSVAGSFFVLSKSNNLAVVGNLFQGETNIPPVWIPLNTLL
jgi:hypothetical protein